jgi:hypothetical protein
MALIGSLVKSPLHGPVREPAQGNWGHSILRTSGLGHWKGDQGMLYSKTGSTAVRKGCRFIRCWRQMNGCRRRLISLLGQLHGEAITVGQ